MHKHPPRASDGRSSPKTARTARVATMKARAWLSRHGSYVRRLSSFAQALACSGGKRAWIGVALAGLDGVVEALGDANVAYTWWRVREYPALSAIVSSVLGPPPQEDGLAHGQVVELGGLTCLRTSEDLFVDGDLGPATTDLRDRVWEKLGPNLEATIREDDSTMLLDVRPVEPQRRATAQGVALVARLRPFVERGRGASCLLIGEPGCGKTTAAAEATAALGAGRSLRIPVGDLARMHGGAFALLRFMRPEVLIVDDIDRHGNPQELLALFDEAGQHARLRIATCNYPKRLGSALLRPGRFDLHVRAEDGEVAAARAEDVAACLAPVAEHLPDGVRVEVEAWPIAYAAALAERLAVLGVDAWSREVAELRRRLEEQRAMDAAEQENDD